MVKVTNTFGRQFSILSGAHGKGDDEGFERELIVGGGTCKHKRKWFDKYSKLIGSQVVMPC